MISDVDVVGPTRDCPVGGLSMAVKYWSLRSLQIKLIKIAGWLVFQLAEVAVPQLPIRGVL